jgi:hypothetical protein
MATFISQVPGLSLAGIRPAYLRESLEIIRLQCLTRAMVGRQQKRICRPVGWQSATPAISLSPTASASAGFLQT